MAFNFLGCPFFSREKVDNFPHLLCPLIQKKLEMKDNLRLSSYICLLANTALFNSFSLSFQFFRESRSMQDWMCYFHRNDEAFSLIYQLESYLTDLLIFSLGYLARHVFVFSPRVFC